MGPIEEREQNQATFRALKPSIDQAYPPGRFVAIHEGKVVGDAPTFRELDDSLTARGHISRNILVIQAGGRLPGLHPYFHSWWSEMSGVSHGQRKPYNGHLPFLDEFAAAGLGGGGLLAGADVFE